MAERGDRIAELLRALPAFAGADPTVLAEAARRTEVVRVAAGSPLPAEPERSDIYVVDGQAELTLRGAPLGLVGPGHSLAEACEGFPATPTITAVTAMRLLVLAPDGTGTPGSDGIR